MLWKHTNQCGAHSSFAGRSLWAARSIPMWGPQQFCLLPIALWCSSYKFPWKEDSQLKLE